jgi:hypothetical protein
MSDGATEFATTHVGSGARLPIVIVPLFLIAVIGLSVIGGPAKSRADEATVAAVPYVAGPMPVIAPGAPGASGIPLLTWSVPHPNEIRVRAHRLMRLGRLSDPYER